MTTIIIKPGDLGGKLVKEAARHKKAIERAQRAAAMRLKTHLVGVVKESGVTDRGTYQNSFKAEKDRVINSAPHAGIIELGARPHKVSLKGIEAIAAWVRRKLGVKGSKHRYQKRDAATGQFGGIHDDAYGIAWAIAKKIEKHGQKPHYFMRDAIPFAKKFFAQELKRILQGEKPS